MTWGPSNFWQLSVPALIFLHFALRQSAHMANTMTRHFASLDGDDDSAY